LRFIFEFANQKVMAKRKLGCLRSHWLRDVQTAWLPFTLTVALCWGNVLRAADSVPSSLPSSNAIPVRLEYQEAGFAVNYWGVSLTTQTVLFSKEPAAVSGKTFHGVLNFGGHSSNTKHYSLRLAARREKIIPRPELQPGIDRRCRGPVFGARGQSD
jgi:hypothetical protein